MYFQTCPFSNKEFQVSPGNNKKLAKITNERTGLTVYAFSHAEEKEMVASLQEAVDYMQSGN